MKVTRILPKPNSMQMNIFLDQVREDLCPLLPGRPEERYAGSLVWKEGKDVRETDIVGFEIRRSDTLR